MKSLYWPVFQLRRLFGTHQIHSRFDALERRLGRLEARGSVASQSDGGASGDYVILPGTPYSHYAVPIEYPPSRDFSPRWGVSKPPIPQLYDWFVGHAADYRGFLQDMRVSAQALKDIPRQFDAERLPTPA